MYTPFKITTDYTLLKSLIKVKDLMNFLVQENITSCGICDENLYGVLDFYNSCKENGIKPIIGLSIKLNDLELYLYAINYEGYKNLLKIHTIKETRELAIIDLEKYSSDMLVILPYKSIELFKIISFYKYVYIGYNNEFEKNNASILSENVVYVNDIRVIRIEDVKYLNYLDDLRKEERKDYSNNYYKKDINIDLNKIHEIESLINIEIPQNKRYIPVYNSTIDSFLFLKNLAYKGLNIRLNNKLTDVYLKRLDHELAIIKEMGFVDYFLIVYDYVLYAKKNNILVGPGRGSAAGSLVSFAIGITDIDPLKYDLLFERFLNPSRVTMPDIDIDFDATKREKVINYVKERYGYENVALGLTFNTLKSKLVIREMGKILKVSDNLIDKFVKNIAANMSLKDNLKNPIIKKYLDSYQELRDVYNVSLKLEGLKKNVSTHAAGVVISSVKLDTVIPIHINNGEIITGVAMEFLENMGLLKMDFLGLKNLTIIANILNNIGDDVLKNIDLNKKEVYELFQKGDTEGIFQFETPAMHSLVLKLKPNSFNDLIAGVALGRPGPKEHALSFIKRKNGLEKITYIHKDLESILKETYGILIYQEQIIAILVKIAEYTYQEADLIRRAISKKKEDILKQEKVRFIKRAVANGYEENIALNIYDLIVKFASYGFNKSHSVAYALIAYQMAYLKAFYPAYFLVELLNNSASDTKNTYYFSYLKSKNINFYKPSINNLYNDYFIKDNKLFMPLWLIKNVNREIANKIIAVKGEKYSDIFDFAYKTKDFMTATLFEKLIRAGALDCFTLNRNTLINNIESALNYAQLQDDEGSIAKPLIVEYPEYSSNILKEDELSSYGFYINNHPTSAFNSKDYFKLMNVSSNLFKKIKCVVVVDKITKIKTKKNENMAFFKASDDTGFADFTVFPGVYNIFSDIKEKDLIMVYGSIEKRFDKNQIIVNNIRKLSDLHE